MSQSEPDAPDYRSAESQRSPVVTTDELERALRDCLSQRAVRPPLRYDPADRVLYRARRIRRSRSAVGAALVVVATGVAGVGGSHLWRGPGTPGTVPMADAPPVVAPSAAMSVAAVPPVPPPLTGDLDRQPLAAVQAPPVDVVIANELHTSGGEWIDLSPIETVSQASRVADGWLVVGDPAVGETTLWFVTGSAAPRPVLPEVDAVAVDPAGARVAWRSGAQLAVASVVDGALTDTRETAAPTESRPVGFVGSAVLMTRDGTDSRVTGYDVWWPERGGYEPAWSESTAVVYGPLPDGRTVVGQVTGPAGRPCLALLDAERGLATVKTACALPLTSDGRGAVSSDGHWLVANGVADIRSATESELAMLVDLSGVFDERPAAPREAGPRLASTVVWTDSGTVVHADGTGELVMVSVDRLSSGRARGVERLSLPVDADTAADLPLVLVDGPAGLLDRR